ncbi:hypothetical protein P154DRAFT_538865 [Amniculicola lignicola CBS 123094]|uniref:DNA-binding protein RAP1 n=1 Tax=Amniculicola lignicola CBS 123094 TaxID=1392246 RepID=A0A6A5W5K5_9PLEO|nr:hypothetical protein P154DRAFT_538865 [Amniculicola lignicola CBS 123094]
MAAPIVYSEVAADANLSGQLFNGLKFFVVQRCPFRSHYLETIKSNGGQVVPLEKHADYIIADHLRRDAPPGSISYQFIDQSVKDGALARPETYPAGPPAGGIRDAGSSRPTKSSRAAYTTEEDRILYEWVRNAEEQGGGVVGNEIYKQLELKSWRDHYLKQLRGRPPANAPPSPPSDNSADQAAASRAVVKQEHKPASSKLAETTTIKNMTSSGTGPSSKAPTHSDEVPEEDFLNLFSKEDWEELYANVEHIGNVPASSYIEGWESWAKETSQSPDQWRKYYEKYVRPQWEQDSRSKREVIMKRVDDRGTAGLEITEQKPVQEAEEAGPSVREPSLEQVVEPPIQKFKLKKRTQVRVSRAKTPEEQEALPANHNRDLLEQKRQKKLAELRDRVRKKGEARDAEGRVSIEPQKARNDIARTRSSSHEPTSPEARERSIDDELFDRIARERRGKSPADAFYFFRREKRYDLANLEDPITDYVEVVKETRRLWNQLSEKRRAPYLDMELADQVRVNKEAGRRAVKRSLGEQDILKESSPPFKKPRHEPSSVPDYTLDAEDVPGTQAQPFEITSGETSSTHTPQEIENHAQPPSDEIMEDFIQAELQTQEDEIDDADSPRESIESDDPPDFIARLPPPPAGYDSDSDKLPSNTPTPRAPRHISAFDTQAILSSPSQSQPLSRLPRPPKDIIQTLASQSPSPLASSPSHRDESISTSHSLQEFRRSVNSPTQPLEPIPRPRPRSTSSSPSPSSQLSDDPDPPLSATEIDAFFATQHDEGFTDEEISTALRITRCRPGLTELVLDRWKEGEPLPDERGVWSREDDEGVKGGDGVELARLERKHGVEGWGGVVERLGWLGQLRG